MNPWLMPDETGDSVTDIANALSNRYGGNQAIFNGLGTEMGLAQDSVPKVTKSVYMPASDQNAGEFDPKTGKIYLDSALPTDSSKMALAHELSHAADMYAAPYPLRSQSHLYFDNQDMPYMNQAIRQNAQEEMKNSRSQKLPNPWAGVQK